MEVELDAIRLHDVSLTLDLSSWSMLARQSTLYFSLAQFLRQGAELEIACDVLRKSRLPKLTMGSLMARLALAQVRI